MKNKRLLVLSIAAIVGAFACSLLTHYSTSREKVSAYSTSSLPTTIDLNDTSTADIRSYYSSLNSLATSERQGTNLLKNLKMLLLL